MSLDSLLTGENAAFIDALYLQWEQDPTSVAPQWASLFQEWAEEDVGYAPRHDAPPTVFQQRSTGGDVGISAHRQARITQLINAYRVHGHHEANIDPLGHRQKQKHPELAPSYYNLHKEDLEATVSGVGVYGVGDVVPANVSFVFACVCVRASVYLMTSTR